MGGPIMVVLWMERENEKENRNRRTNEKNCVTRAVKNAFKYIWNVEFI